MDTSVTNDTQPTYRTMDELMASPLVPAIPKIGDIISGKVLSATKNEVRIDIDGVTTGVVRGRERFDASGEYTTIAVGDIVDATVTDIDNERGELELSFVDAGRQKAWTKLRALQASGEVIGVQVVGANKGGLLVKVGNMAGFLPVSQLAPEHYPRVEDGDKNKILERLQSFVNMTMQVKVIDLNDQEEKLIVSEKAAWERQQSATLSQYKVGETIEGKVTGLVDFGAFVELPQGLEGLIHISEIAWQRLDHARDVLAVGQMVKAQIIAIEGSRISLSMKRLTPDPWSTVLERYQVGQTVEGKVLKVNPFGLFVELDPQIHGLAHVSELSHAPNVNVNALAKPGDTLAFKIISVEPREHRLGLSRKALDTAGAPEPVAAAVEEKKE